MKVPRRKKRTASVGVFAVGHYAYWSQFDGLIDNAQGAYAMVPKLKAPPLDLIFCDMVTYATSSTFGILVRELDVPIVLVAPNKFVDEFALDGLAYYYEGPITMLSIGHRAETIRRIAEILNIESAVVTAGRDAPLR